MKRKEKGKGEEEGEEEKKPKKTKGKVMLKSTVNTNTPVKFRKTLPPQLQVVPQRRCFAFFFFLLLSLSNFLTESKL